MVHQVKSFGPLLLHLQPFQLDDLQLKSVQLLLFHFILDLVLLNLGLQGLNFYLELGVLTLLRS